MTYARTRLWLGITGVGGLVVAASVLLIVGPEAFLSLSTSETENQAWLQTLLSDSRGLGLFLGAFVLYMIPFDLVGGFLAPSKHGKLNVGFATFARQWGIGVLVQAALFMATGLAILAAGRSAGLFGALSVVVAGSLSYLILQPLLLRAFTSRSESHADSDALAPVREILTKWGYSLRRASIVDHRDPGYTGGIVGVPGRDVIVVPRRWAEELEPELLAVALSRRIEAITSGSRRNGVLLAFGWTVIGFTIATQLSGAGVASVPELVATLCGFTLWSFLGLLVLPTISRSASFNIDGRIRDQGIDVELFHDAIRTLEGFNEDEQERSPALEAIFHPVPSVSRRAGSLPEVSASSAGPDRPLGATTPRIGAWHAARMTLFLSWSCLGLLSRAVHCNVGRPELWTMLPTD